MNGNKNEIVDDVIQETKEFTLRSVIVLITTIYFFLAYKIISKRISYLITKYDVTNMFSSYFGEISIFNTLILMLIIYFVYYIGKKILSYIFKENFDIKDLGKFFMRSF